MLSLYLASLAFGSVLIGASLFLGGDNDKSADGSGDGDFGKGDFDKGSFELSKGDLDKGAFEFGKGDLDKGALDLAKDGLDAAHSGALAKDTAPPLWLPILSLRFWTFGSFAFGLSGTLLHLIVGGFAFPLMFSALMGAGMGTAGAYVFRSLNRSEASGEVSLARFVGEEARVIVPVRPGEIGKIAVRTLAGTVEIPARSRDEAVLEAGATVLVAHIERGEALVTGLTPASAAKGAADRLPSAT